MSDSGTQTPVMERPAEPEKAPTQTRVAGVVAQFDTVDDILAAAAKCRDHGFTKWDCHTPFPVHGLDQAMGIKNTVLPWLVFCGGVAGCGTGFLLQWWMNAVDYPYLISGKPEISFAIYIPVMFELTVLFSALTTFFGMWGMNGLPQLYHPTFLSQKIKRATDDKFFVSVEAEDPKFDVDATTKFLKDIGASDTERLDEPLTGENR